MYAAIMYHMNGGGNARREGNTGREPGGGGEMDVTCIYYKTSN